MIVSCFRSGPAALAPVIAYSNSPTITWDASTPTPAFYYIYKASSLSALTAAVLADQSAGIASNFYASVTGDTTTWTDPTPGTGLQYYQIVAVSSGGALSSASSVLIRSY